MIYGYIRLSNNEKTVENKCLEINIFYERGISKLLGRLRKQLVARNLITKGNLEPLMRIQKMI